MSRGLFFAVLIGALLAAPGIGQAQNLLVNPGLEFPENTFYHSVPDGWQMTEGPAVPFLPGPYLADYNESGATPANCVLNGYCDAVDAADYTVWHDHLGATQAANGYTLPNEAATTGNVTVADYNQWKLHFGAPHALSMAEPTNFPHTLLEGNWNMWFQPYNGTFAALPEALNNFAHLTQIVPAAPGTSYTLKGWAAFEPHFAGGRTNLNLAGSSATPPDDGPISPTDTFFALDFLDSNGVVLDTEEIELLADGQQNTPVGSSLVWMQHTLSAVAPAGTANVKVRITMLNGVLNPNVDPQSMFVDFFELTTSAGAGSATVVPEPTTAFLSILYSAAMFAVRRNRFRGDPNARC